MVNEMKNPNTMHEEPYDVIAGRMIRFAQAEAEMRRQISVHNMIRALSFGLFMEENAALVSKLTAAQGGCRFEFYHKL